MGLTVCAWGSTGIKTSVSWLTKVSFLNARVANVGHLNLAAVETSRSGHCGARRPDNRMDVA